MPAPTDAPAPPDDPPAMCSCDHGEQVGPHSAVSVVPMMPHSDVVARPSDTRPARRKRRISPVSDGTTQPCDSLLPFSHTRPASPW